MSRRKRFLVHVYTQQACVLYTYLNRVVKLVMIKQLLPVVLSFILSINTWQYNDIKYHKDDTCHLTCESQKHWLYFCHNNLTNPTLISIIINTPCKINGKYFYLMSKAQSELCAWGKGWSIIQWNVTVRQRGRGNTRKRKEKKKKNIWVWGNTNDRASLGKSRRYE